MAELGIFLLAAAALLLEIALTRAFAIAQFYHFAFLAVSMALLGYGVSGTWLSLRPEWARGSASRRLSWCALAFAFSALLGFLAANEIPFDSYTIAWERRQILYLAAYLLSLTAPFVFAGLSVALALSSEPDRVYRLYGANLLGSAAGGVLGPAALWLAGGTAGVMASAALAMGAAAAFRRDPRWRWGAAALGLVLLLWMPWPPAWMQPRLSPYKGLSQVLHFPDARVVFHGENAQARVDVVESSSIRSLPGLSYAYQGAIPPQRALFIDGDGLMPIVRADQVVDWSFVDALPTAIAYRLRPGGRVMILNARSGLEIWTALKAGASAVVAVESNPLVVRAVNETAEESPYRQPAVEMLIGEPRSVLQRYRGSLDLIVLPIQEPFRPITSGAYSLGESYELTLEAFEACLRHLSPNGILVVHRWLQTPPSESVRAAALAVEAWQRAGLNPADHIVAFRGIQTMTILAFRSPPSPEDLQAIRSMTNALRFDLVAAPDLRAEEMNRINRLPEPYYEQALAALLSGDRRAFYRSYPFAVWPPTDDRPFFFHFFKWAQTPAILRTLGQTWQPFGGSGYFVLVALFLLVTLASAALIVLPLVVGPHRARLLASGAGWRRALIYFGGLGLGYLLVEIPLIQRSILYLGHPTLALATVLTGLLISSGVGSLWLAPKVPVRSALWVLVVVIAVVSVTLRWVHMATLGWPALARWLMTLALVSVPGALMGIPFAAGLMRFERELRGITPWAWAVNGSLSVVSAVLAALLALDLGFRGVMWAGAGAYLLAWWASSALRPRGADAGR